jgi:hypothetical protein
VYGKKQKKPLNGHGKSPLPVPTSNTKNPT